MPCERLRHRQLGAMLQSQGADVAPTAVVVEAAGKLHDSAPGLVAAWQQAKLQDLPGINKQLQEAKLKPLKPHPEQPDEVEIDINRDEE